MQTKKDSAYFKSLGKATAFFTSAAGIDEDNQLIFLAWANQFRAQSKTVREVHLNLCVVSDVGTFFTGYYDYGIVLLRQGFTVFYLKQKKTFYFFKKDTFECLNPLP